MKLDRSGQEEDLFGLFCVRVDETAARATLYGRLPAQLEQVVPRKR